MNQNGDADRTIQSIGIEVHGGFAVILIPSGSRTPVARAMTFTTVADGQGAVEVRIVRCSVPGGAGPQRAVQAGRPQGVAGRFLLPGLRRGPRGQARIDIGISLDREGVLRAWGADRHTGARQDATLSGLWALPPRARGGALSRMARRVEAETGLPGAALLGEEGRLLRARGEEGAGGALLAALAGELDALRRSTTEPPVAARR